MLSREQKLNNIRRQANELHRVLMKTAGSHKANEMEKIYQDVRDADSQHTPQEQGLVYDVNDDNAVAVRNASIGVFTGLGGTSSDKPRHNSGKGPETRLQSDLAEWYRLDPANAKVVITNADGVKHAIKDHDIVNVPSDDWPSTSDCGADEMLVASTQALHTGYRWFCVTRPYDDLTCSRAYIPRPYQVVSRMKFSLDLVKYHAEQKYHRNEAKALHDLITKVMKSNLFRDYNYEDIKAIRKSLFVDHGKRFTKQNSRVHGALVMLEDLINHRFHRQLVGYVFNDDGFSLIENRQLLKLDEERLENGFGQHNKEAVNEVQTALFQLNTFVMKSSPDKYFAVSGKHFRAPSAREVALILLEAVGVLSGAKASALD